MRNRLHIPKEIENKLSKNEIDMMNKGALEEEKRRLTLSSTPINLNQCSTEQFEDSIMHRRSYEKTQTPTPNKVFSSLTPEDLESMTPEQIECARNLTPKEVSVIRHLSRAADREKHPKRYKYSPEEFTKWEEDILTTLYKWTFQLNKEMKLKRSSIDSYLKEVSVAQEKALKFFQDGMDDNDLLQVEDALTHFHRRNLTLTDEQLDEALKKNGEIFELLEKHQKTVAKHLVKTMGAVYALKIALNYQAISIQLLIKIFKVQPDGVNEVENYKDGNTLLHQLLIEKNDVKIKAYLVAYLTAKCMGININPDKEKKNKANQTVLQLAIANGDKDTIASILLYWNPKYFESEAELAPHNFIFSEIRRERDDLILEAVSGIARRQKLLDKVEKRTIKNQQMLAIQQGEIDHRLNQVDQLTAINYVEINAIGHYVGQLALPNTHPPVSIVELPDEEETQQFLMQPPARLQLEAPSVYHARNPDLLFSLSANKRQAKPTVTLQDENPVELLKSIREEINESKKIIKHELNKVCILEKQLMDIESQLCVNADTGIPISHRTRLTMINKSST